MNLLLIGLKKNPPPEARSTFNYLYSSVHAMVWNMWTSWQPKSIIDNFNITRKWPNYTVKTNSKKVVFKLAEIASPACNHAILLQETETELLLWRCQLYQSYLEWPWFSIDSAHSFLRQYNPPKFSILSLKDYEQPYSTTIHWNLW